MKDIYDQYADLSREHFNLLADYKDVLEDSKLLDLVMEHQIGIYPQDGSYIHEDGNLVWLPWRACTKDTMGPASSTVREAIKSLCEAIDKAIEFEEE